MNSIFCKTSATAVFLALSMTLLQRAAFAETVFAVSYDTGELIRYDSTDPSNTRTTLLPVGALALPGALAIGPDGKLYIGENGDGSTLAPRISTLDPASLDFSIVHAFAGFDLFPASLVFRGNDLLVGRNPFFGSTGPIVMLNNATGGTPAVSHYTTGGGLASSPGLALAPDGRLIVSDHTYNFITGISNGSVKWFDAGGAYGGEWISSGSSNLAGPTGMAIFGETLYTASIMNGGILKTDLTTGLTTVHAAANGPFETGVVGVLADGSLLAGSPSGSGNIYHFGADGTLQGTFASGLGQIGGIAVVPEPGALGLALAGLLASGFCLRRRPVARH